MLRTENIHFSIGHKKILHGISADFVPGKLNMILGPNGSGKSTFLKIFSGETRHFTGRVEYDQRNITSLDYPALAKFRAVMSQQTELSFPLTAEEVVMMGRYPHFDFNPSSPKLAKSFFHFTIFFAPSITLVILPPTRYCS